MGFLIFAFRKLTLRREINEKNYRLMVLNNNLNKIHDQQQYMQQAQAAMKNLWTTSSSALTQSATTISNLDNMAYQSKVDSATAKYNEVYKTGDQVKIAEAYKAVEQANSEQANQKIKSATIFQGLQAASIAANAAVESVFSTANDAQLAVLNQQDAQYDLEKESLESQLTLLNEEYNNVKKAEGEAAKNVAPSFGLG